jgi:hypothetical protein
MSPLWLACSLALLGHNPDTSYARVEIGAERIKTRLTYDIFTLLKVVPLDDNGDGQLSRSEFSRHAPELERFLRDRIGLSISADDETADLGQFLGQVWPPDVGEAIPEADYHSANGLVHFDFSRPLEITPEEVAIAFGFFERFGERHTVLGVFTYQGEDYETTFTRFEPDFTYVTGFVSPDTSPEIAPRPPPTSETAMANRLWRFFKLGVEHILIGYDHICFLIALIVVSRFREVVKIVTSFTIAHSITLILAALDVVRLPTQLVETCIAATIVYVAVENLWIVGARSAERGAGNGSGESSAAGRSAFPVMGSTRHRWLLTFFFGLVHGFGFANVLREMGLPTTGLVRCLISFNVGVEVGQLAIATLLLPLALALGRWKHGRKVVVAVSVLLALFGAAWFFDRAMSLELMPF